jgi:hypothetical protein
VALFLRGRWREARETIDAAYAELTNHVAGWQTQASLYALYALAYQGDFHELRRRHTHMLADAEQRGDLLTSVQLRASHPTILALASDDPDAARRQTREAAEAWPHTKYLVQHWQIMRSEAEIELYAGEGDKAYERLRKDEVALKQSHLLTVQLMRALTAFARGRAAIAASGASGAERDLRLREAQRFALQLEREKMPWTSALAALLWASVRIAEDNEDGARQSLRRGIELATAAEMNLYAAAARHRLGRLLAGPQGQELVGQAEEEMHAQNIRVPERFANMFVPSVRRA